MKAKHSDSILWLVITFAAAAVCTAVRRWQLSAAFEGTLQLPIPMALPTIILVVLYILCAVVLFLLSRKQQLPDALRQAPHFTLYANGDTLFMGALVCAAFLSLIAAPLLFRDGIQLWRTYQSALAAAKAYGGNVPGGNNGLLTLITAVTSFLSFLGLLMTCKAASRGLNKGRLGVLLPVINGCLWLMDTYRDQAANPVLWDYVPQLLAIVLGIFMYLDWAGLNAGVFSPRRALWLAGMTIIFSATALAGGEWNLSSAILLCAQIITAFALLWRIPANLKYPPEPVTEEAPAAEEKLEEETHE